MPEQNDEPMLADSATSESAENSRGLPDELHQALRAELAGPAFGLPFFGAMLSGRIEDGCSGVQPDVPQVLLHLASGAVLDICHIVEFAPRWIATEVFRDDRSCEQMDLEFLPYQLIVRVTVSSRASDERRLGFDVQRSLAAWEASATQQECHEATSS